MTSYQFLTTEYFERFINATVLSLRNCMGFKDEKTVVRTSWNLQPRFIRQKFCFYLLGCADFQCYCAALPSCLLVCFVDIYFKELGGIISISPILCQSCYYHHPVVGRLQWFFFRFRKGYVPPFFALLWKIKRPYMSRELLFALSFCYSTARVALGRHFFPLTHRMKLYCLCNPHSWKFEISNAYSFLP